MPRLVGICSVSECGKEDKLTRGMCQTHYERDRRSGRHGVCSVVECQKGIMGRGFCGTHYYRWRQGLDLEAGPMRGLDRWGEWATNAKGYVYRRKTLPDGHREVQWQHQLVMEQHIGRALEKGEEVHHLNGVRNDNRLENLELWSTRQPKGQRWQDKLEHAYEMIRLYGDLSSP